MLDKGEFKTIRRDLERLDKEREAVIHNSRKVIKLSKLAIYALLRNEESAAQKNMDLIEKQVKSIKKGSTDTSIDKTALAEYVEASTLYWFIKKGKLPTRSDLKVDTESYLCGLCDLTGELMRMAVGKMIQGKVDDVQKIKDLLMEIYGEFLHFNLRNGELRKKSDAIKWNLTKVEDLLLCTRKGAI
ncbi:hypothetical protein J4430_03095 [Candidatus Woesearchaeota archaeon]|nr:hypothetical protein [Candidatus Woesearchaeota archaeon]